MLNRPIAPALLLVLVAGCAAPAPTADPANAEVSSVGAAPSTSTSSATVSTANAATPPGVPPKTVRALPLDTDVDYQLGGAVQPAPNVGILARDRKAPPVAGKYNICYVNAFQTQPDETAFWEKHPNLILARNGKPVTDAEWGEQLLDIRTAAKRNSLAGIVGGWIRKCAAEGYAGVEFDNFDSFTRSGSLLTKAHAVTFARQLIEVAHAAGLAAGQKNFAEYDGHAIGFDFAVAEECGRWKECDDYVRNYGRQVIMIEYRRTDFEWTCKHYGSRLAVVRRDVNLTPKGIRAWC